MSDRIQVLCGIEAVNPKALLPCLLKTRIVTFGFGSERIKLFERDTFTVDRKTIIIGKLGKHPWKAEISEDDTGVASDTISGWYTQVYEPTYAE